MTRATKIYFYAVAVGYVVWAFAAIPGLPVHEQRFALAVAALFFVLYVFPLTVFGGQLQPMDDGLHVNQYQKTLIPYAEVRHCFGIFIFPFQFAVVTTTRRFPLNVVLAGDRIVGRRRSLLQDGELVASVKARMLARHGL